MALHLLAPGGSFVAKVFRGKDFVYLFTFLQKLFKQVYITKPRSCRNSSIEGFIVCRDFDPQIKVSPFLNPEDCTTVLNVLQEDPYFDPQELPEIEFEAFYVGEESDLDPDMNYPLSYEVIKGKKYEYKEPV